MKTISVVIITRNEEAKIQRCLNSVKGIASEIVIVDSLSTDKTVAICEAFGCRIFVHAFEGYGRQKQFATDQAVNDWVLSIDADEVISPRLQAELKEFAATTPKGKEDVDAYYIPFVLNYMGSLLRHCGTGKNLRLFNRNTCTFTLVPVHESIVIKGSPGRMKGQIIHYSYRDICHHLEKINYYTSLAAEGNKRSRRRFHNFRVAFIFPVTFCIYYFIRLGILDGYPGFMWSFMAAFYTSLKTAKTIELTKL